MRVALQLLLLIIVIICVTEAHKKDRWREKKHRSKSTHWELENDMDKSGYGKHYELKKKYMRERMADHKKDKHHKKGKYGHKKHLSWLNIKKDSDCDIKCQRDEVCITGPIDVKPMCVHKKDLKKSIKMFHRYQKKEMKAWKHFKKDRYNDIKKGDDYGDMKIDYIDEKKPMVEERHFTEVGKLKYSDDINKKINQEEMQPYKPPTPMEDDSADECSTSQFSQMRTRMMGWFHLLHGQDHLARKAHDGNIKHFYKHVSVKKELREHDGDKCECLKSAMWQFQQMDNNEDDHLDEKEIGLLKENTMEPCVEPYLTSCDRNADGVLSSDEWCCCFANVVAPCFKKVDEVRRSGKPVTYMPRCDKEGYYMREQCEGETDDTLTCWCVDYNGNEHKGTRTKGRAHCTKIALYAMKKVPLA